MNSDAHNNAATSATTHKPKQISEARFLALESETAGLALSKSLADFGHSAASAANPRLWAKEHPWATVGFGLVGALALARVVIPSRKRGEGGRWRDYFKEPQEQKEKEPSTRKKSWVKVLTQELFSIAQPVIASAVTASIRAKTAQSAQGNGHSTNVR